MIAWIVAHRDVVVPLATLVAGLIAGRLLSGTRRRPARPAVRTDVRRHRQSPRAEQIIGHQPATPSTMDAPTAVMDQVPPACRQPTLYMSTHDLRRALTTPTAEWPVNRERRRSWTS